MSWDLSVGQLRNELPHFNDYLLRGYRKEQVEKFPQFVDTIFSEAVKLFNGALKYRGYQILSPERRIQYVNNRRINPGHVNIQQSELSLMEFVFEYEGQLLPVRLYLPYLYENALVIEDTRYYMQHDIIERMIFRVTDGVIIKVMRSPLQFWRSEQLTCETTAGESFREYVITVKAHYRRGSGSKVIRTPLVLYLLAEYEFQYVVNNILELPQGSVTFTDTDDQDDPQYIYFKCIDNIYLKVDKEAVMRDRTSERFVISLLYILKMVKQYNIADVLDKTFYRMILGKNLYSMKTKDNLAVGHADSHLDSLRTYLDRHTKNDLALMKIYCDNVFDLFVHVFVNIDEWLISYSPNDLFEKRLGGADVLLMDLVKAIFNRFYETLKKPKAVTIDNIKSMLKFSDMTVKHINNVPSLQPNCALYNDNDLPAILIKKTRSSGPDGNGRRKGGGNLMSDKEHQFHPSFAAVEGLLAISPSNPGVTGDINPFVEIDNMGYFQKDKMPWYNEIKDLVKYLVRI